MGTDKEKRAAADLRRLAEERLQVKTAGSPTPRSEDATERLVHELEVHQIELEMQNEELRKARNDAELALRKYTEMFDFAPIGRFTLGRDCAIKAVNLRGAGLLGMERSRLLNRRFEPFVARESLRLFKTFWTNVLASEGRESCELSLNSEGNQQRFVHIEAVTDASGEECNLAITDLTDRVRAEKALAEKVGEIEELNNSLEARIAQAVDAMRQKDQLLVVQARLAAMGEMINNIAHQWRQPLNTLGLLVQQVPMYYNKGGFSKEFLTDNTAKAMRLINHMSKTINTFSDFFRTDKEPVHFDVNEVIGATLSLIEWIFKEKGIEIVLHYDTDVMTNGYPNEYAQVLLNILMNAYDAHLSHHALKEPVITIHTAMNQGKTVVTIYNNAGHISDEVIDKLFDPYFTTKGPDKGTGIGLFMSKTIIEKNMGGTLAVRNIGNGAEFRIEV
jgi:signal transduction histidine kinase